MTEMVTNSPSRANLPRTTELELPWRGQGGGGGSRFIPWGAAAAWSFRGSQKRPMVLPWAELFCVVWAVIWQEVALL